MLLKNLVQLKENTTGKEPIEDMSFRELSHNIHPLSKKNLNKFTLMGTTLKDWVDVCLLEIGELAIKEKQHGPWTVGNQDITIYYMVKDKYFLIKNEIEYELYRSNDPEVDSSTEIKYYYLYPDEDEYAEKNDFGEFHSSMKNEEKLGVVLF